MKKSIIIICWSIVSLSFGIDIINQSVDTIVDALKKGDAELLSSYFNSTVELSTPSGDGVYSKAQAKQILARFFEKNTPTGAKIVHRGSSGNNANYAVVSLETTKGKFRVNLFMKQNGNTNLVHELKIESE